MGEDRFPHGERLKKPYLVLVDPATGRGVAYDAGNRLMGEEASAELVAFARQQPVRVDAWNDRFDHGRQRAAWMPQGSLRGWLLCWLRDSSSTAADLRATPDS